MDAATPTTHAVQAMQALHAIMMMCIGTIHAETLKKGSRTVHQEPARTAHAQDAILIQHLHATTMIYFGITHAASLKR